MAREPTDRPSTSRRSALKSVVAAGVGTAVTGGFGGGYAVDTADAATAPDFTESWADDYQYEESYSGDDVSVTATFGVAQMDKGAVEIGCEDQDHWGYRFGIYGLGTATHRDSYGYLTGANFVQGHELDVNSEKVCGSDATIEPFDSYMVEPTGSEYDTFLDESHYAEDEDLDSFGDVEYWCNQWEEDHDDVDKHEDWADWDTALAGVGLLSGVLSGSATLGVAGVTLSAVSFVDSMVDFGMRRIEDDTDTSITIYESGYDRPMALHYVDFRAYVPPHTSLEIDVYQNVAFTDYNASGRTIDGNIDSDACYEISIPSQDGPNEKDDPWDAMVVDCSDTRD